MEVQDLRLSCLQSDDDTGQAGMVPLQDMQ